LELFALDLCTGGGGEALGLEQAGFGNAASVEIDETACQTLRLNRPQWKVLPADIRDLDCRQFRGVDLVAAGVPCPPFSIAGKQLGADDGRDLFPYAIRIVEQVQPPAVMIENVRGLAGSRFTVYRANVLQSLINLGYETDYRILNASDYGVPQLRPRFVLVALRPAIFRAFEWPAPEGTPPTVGDTLASLMGANGWPGTERWISGAQTIAPTLVGGSHKHGGPDLGPTRARGQWRSLGVDGLGLAGEPPGPDFPLDGMPRLTVRMAARIQGFPDEWHFVGGKTAAYRQVGNAFPPPVAKAVARAISAAISSASNPVSGAYYSFASVMRVSRTHEEEEAYHA
jgi:DNA (cytosine-5)-methyltransferase 1